jgi:hypothetical protein
VLISRTANACLEIRGQTPDSGVQSEIEAGAENNEESVLGGYGMLRPEQSNALLVQHKLYTHKTKNGLRAG